MCFHDPDCEYNPYRRLGRRMKGNDMPRKGLSVSLVPLAAAICQIRSGLLDFDQQNRLSRAWMDIASSGLWRVSSERDWQLAMCYTDPEWAVVRSRFEPVLSKSPEVWTMAWMIEEGERQQEFSDRQRAKVEKRWSGIPKDTTVYPGIPEGTLGYVVLGSVGSESKSTPYAHPAEKPPDSPRAVASLNGHAPKAKAKPALNGEWDEAFERHAWPLVWRSVGKQSARKAWHKIVPQDADMLEAICSGMEFHGPAYRQREMEKRPHLATYLNGRRWEDKDA